MSASPAVLDAVQDAIRNGSDFDALLAKLQNVRDVALNRDDEETAYEMDDLCDSLVENDLDVAGVQERLASVESVLVAEGASDQLTLVNG